MKTVSIDTGAVIMPAMEIPLLNVVPGDVLTLDVSDGIVSCGKLTWSEELLIKEINSGLWWYHSASGVSKVSQKAHPGIIKAVKYLSLEIGNELKEIILQFKTENKSLENDIDIEPVEVEIDGDDKPAAPHNKYMEMQQNSKNLKCSGSPRH